MGQLHKRKMTMQPLPLAAFIVVKTKFTFGVLVVAFHDPAHMQQTGLLFQREFVQTPNEVLLALAPMAGQGPLADQPVPPLAGLPKCLARCPAR